MHELRGRHALAFVGGPTIVYPIRFSSAYYIYRIESVRRPHASLINRYAMPATSHFAVQRVSLCCLLVRLLVRRRALRAVDCWQSE